MPFPETPSGMTSGMPAHRRVAGGAALGLLLPSLLLLSLLLLAACAAPARPTGAPALKSDVALGANEVTPGATQAPSAPDSPTAGPPTTATPALTTPFTCPQEHTDTVYTSAQLKQALAGARPGDVIDVEPGLYIGHFTARAKGTAQHPIYLCGPQEAVLDGRALNKGYVLHLEHAENWRLDGFSVEDGLKGVMVDGGKDNVLQNLRVQSIGDEGVHLRDGSTGNVVQDVTVRKTGRQDAKFGEGIYVGTAKSNWCDVSDCKPDRSDHNVLLNNKIFLTTAESIDIKEGTSNGVISGNTFDGRGMTAADSWVDVKGNGWKILGNHGQYSGHDGYQTHVILKGWGTGNVFSGNSADLVDSVGVGFYVQKKLTNKVDCDNAEDGGKQGLTNIACSP
jgi:hypothetical protein